MQKLQRSSQPFMVVTSAATGRSGPESPGAQVETGAAEMSNSVRAVGGAPAICSNSSAGSSDMLSGPTTKSTWRIRPRSFSPSCCATHPATATTRSGRPAFTVASFPTSLRSFCSAFSRTLHVLKTIEIGVVRRFHGDAAGRAEHPRDPVGVVHVHLAAERSKDVAKVHVGGRDDSTLAWLSRFERFEEWPRAISLPVPCKNPQSYRSARRSREPPWRSPRHLRLARSTPPTRQGSLTRAR